MPQTTDILELDQLTSDVSYGIDLDLNEINLENKELISHNVSHQYVTFSYDDNNYAILIDNINIAFYEQEIIQSEYLKVLIDFERIENSEDIKDIDYIFLY